MKKLIALLLALALMVTVTGCGESKLPIEVVIDDTTSNSNETTTNDTTTSTSIQTTTTTFDTSRLDPSKTVMLTIECEVDPQIQKKELPIYLDLCNVTKRHNFIIVLQKETSYRAQLEVNEGEYVTNIHEVLGDLKQEYKVEYKHFIAYGSTTEVKIKVGLNDKDKDEEEERFVEFLEHDTNNLANVSFRVKERGVVRFVPLYEVEPFYWEKITVRAQNRTDGSETLLDLRRDYSCFLDPGEYDVYISITDTENPDQPARYTVTGLTPDFDPHMDDVSFYVGILRKDQ